jgi:hypothetical protein
MNTLEFHDICELAYMNTMHINIMVCYFLNRDEEKNNTKLFNKSHYNDVNNALFL